MTDLRKLLDAATKGPWQVITETHPGNTPANRPHIERRIATTWIHGQLRAPTPVVNQSFGFSEGKELSMVRINEPDAAMIVAAVNALPALLDVVEAAKRFMDVRHALTLPHGVDLASEYFSASTALTAALAQWEKQ